MVFHCRTKNKTYFANSKTTKYFILNLHSILAMSTVKNYFIVLVFLLLQISLFAQTANFNIDALLSEADSIPLNQKTEQEVIQNKFPLKSFIIPAGLITYGAITMSSHGPNSINGKLQKEIWIDKPHSTNGLDNFLMFAPAVSVYALNAFGVKGKNNFRDRTMIYLMSGIITNAIVYPIKSLANQERPNGKRYSFPSGHTAVAFASAEFMRMEYKERSPWYGFAGYLMATATGYLRMYNNKHWFSDVVAGAGIGIASTQFSYWLYPKIKKALFKDKPSNTIVMPTYEPRKFGLAVIHKF